MKARPVEAATVSGPCFGSVRKRKAWALQADVAPRVQTCCISILDEARSAVHYGYRRWDLRPDMRSGLGVIADALIAKTTTAVPPPVATFPLAELCQTDTIIRQHVVCLPSAIQRDDTVQPKLRHTRRSVSGVI